MARAFVIRPFEIKKDSSGKEIDFDSVHNDLILPSLADTGFDKETTTVDILASGNIREDMFKLIFEADLVICDITIHNANVFYELGIRHALRKKRTILIKGKPTADKTPFDLQTDRYLSYDVDDPAAAKDKLTETIDETKKSDRKTDSPIFEFIPNLPEAALSAVQKVPLDFREEVKRAQASQAKGWLRLLSEEVRRQRFQWEGLRFVATAQWALRDYEGAIDSWESIRKVHESNVPANGALAEIYWEQSEQASAHEHWKKLRQQSEEAIDRVLNSETSTREDCARALILRGHNQKTEWRRDFSEIQGIHRIVEAYKTYCEAFRQQPAYVYSAMAAFQMGTILNHLSKEETWLDAFDTDKKAEDFKSELNDDLQMFRSFVKSLLDTELEQAKLNTSEWNLAMINKAEYLFLTNERESRVLRAYMDAIPPDLPGSQWDTARRQLEVYSDLGLHKEIVHNVIEAIDERLKRPKPNEVKPLHVIIFAGHRVDEPGRAELRFPDKEEALSLATTLIHKVVDGLRNEDHRLLGIASAAPGADILFHEICHELNIPTKVCLPMPSKDFARHTFEKLDDWRSRFLDLLKASNKDVLELSDREGLPRWLQGKDMNLWERGNLWVLQMALTSDADKITLVSLWDNKEKGDAPGGTAHMVNLARTEGADSVHFERIDSTQLLG